MLNKSKNFKISILNFFVLFIFIPTSLFSDPVKPSFYSNNPIVAEVDGESIHLDDLKHARIQEALVQLYQMKKRSLKEKVLQKLVKKHPELGMETKLKVSDEEVEKFYNNTPGIKDLGNLQQMRNEIQDYLKNSYRNIFIEQQYQHAVKKGWVKVYLTPPNDFRLEAGVGTAMLWSAKNKLARVFVLEYSDFQCPFCKRVQSTLKKIRKKYPKKVQFGYRHFPLPFHKEAKVFAQAVECARDQGKFWELQRWLFDNLTQGYSNKQVLDAAKLSGVKDIDSFKLCLKKGKYLKRVETDIREGIEIGIQGTPTFVVGSFDQDSKIVSGEMFSGAVSEEKFVETIEKYLALARTEAKSNP